MNNILKMDSVEIEKICKEMCLDIDDVTSEIKKHKDIYEDIVNNPSMKCEFFEIAYGMVNKINSSQMIVQRKFNDIIVVIDKAVKSREQIEDKFAKKLSELGTEEY
jgi:hypothetical protein